MVSFEECTWCLKQRFSVESAGEHDIMVRLSDTEHCYYSTVVMTTVTLAGESGR